MEQTVKHLLIYTFPSRNYGQFNLNFNKFIQILFSEKMISLYETSSLWFKSSIMYKHKIFYLKLWPSKMTHIAKESNVLWKYINTRKNHAMMKSFIKKFACFFVILVIFRVCVWTRTSYFQLLDDTPIVGTVLYNILLFRGKNWTIT